MTGRRPWTGAEVTAFGVALHGSAVGWQAALARRLDVDIDEVRKWADEGADAYVAGQLRGLAGSDDPDAHVMVPRDEWLFAEGAGGGRREYLIHAWPPRFVGRIVVMDEDGEQPAAEEMPANVRSGVVFNLFHRSVLAEIQWIDPPPDGPDLLALLEAGADALFAALRDEPG